MVVIFCRVSPSDWMISQILPEETFAFLLTTEATIQSIELRFPLQSLSTELDNQSSSDGERKLRTELGKFEQRADGFSATCHSAAVSAGSAVHCITLSLRYCLIQFSSFFTL